MRRTTGTLALAAALLAGGAGAETLYQQDGITLKGDGADGDAHGQPLHVWQLNFAARNDSGRQLKHLTARFSIAAEAPPCTS